MAPAKYGPTQASLICGRARSLQAGPVRGNLAARRAAEGLPAPAAGLLVGNSLVRVRVMRLSAIRVMVSYG